MASHDAEGVVERARRWQPLSVDVEPVGLREAFLETVKEEA
jgi:hypothetical protein